MKRTFLCLLIGLGIYFAQAQSYFVQTIGGAPQADIELKDLVICPNGEIISVGSKNDQAYLVKTKSDGTILWAGYINTSHYSQIERVVMMPGSSTEFVVSGNHLPSNQEIFVAKITEQQSGSNYNLNINWARSIIPSNNPVDYKMWAEELITANSRIVLTGTAELFASPKYHAILELEIDFSGNLMSAPHGYGQFQTGSLLREIHGFAIDKEANNSITVSGAGRLTSSLQTVGLLVKEWAGGPPGKLVRYYSLNQADIIFNDLEDDVDCYYVCGFEYLAKIARQTAQVNGVIYNPGEVIWCKSYEIDGTAKRIEKLLYHNGLLYAVGTGFVMELDLDGVPNWAKGYPDDNINNLDIHTYAALKTNGVKLLLAGYLSTLEPSKIVHADLTGDVDCDNLTKEVTYESVTLQEHTWTETDFSMESNSLEWAVDMLNETADICRTCDISLDVSGETGSLSNGNSMGSFTYDVTLPVGVVLNSVFVDWGDGNSNMYFSPSLGVFHHYSTYTPCLNCPDPFAPITTTVCVTVYATGPNNELCSFTYCFEIDIPVGSNTSSGKRDGTTSTSEHIDDKTTRLFPNPTTHQLSVTSSQKIERIHIYSIDGQLVKEVKAINSEIANIDISGLSEGIYTIKVMTESGQYVEQFVKQ